MQQYTLHTLDETMNLIYSTVYVGRRGFLGGAVSIHIVKDTRNNSVISFMVI